MYSLKKQKGFTIVELLIVIVVIGILATLVIVTFTGIQKRGRDSQRQTDVNAVASQVAAYYADKGTYPTLADLQNTTFVSDNLKGLDPEALKDPKGTSTIGATASATQYGYVAASSTTGVTCTNTTASSDSNQCDTYTLTAKLENGTDFVKKGN